MIHVQQSDLTVKKKEKNIKQPYLYIYIYIYRARKFYTTLIDSRVHFTHIVGVPYTVSHFSPIIASNDFVGLKERASNTIVIPACNMVNNPLFRPYTWKNGTFKHTLCSILIPDLNALYNKTWQTSRLAHIRCRSNTLYTCPELFNNDLCDKSVAFGLPVVPEVNCILLPLWHDIRSCSPATRSTSIFDASCSTSANRRVPLRSVSN